MTAKPEPARSVLCHEGKLPNAGLKDDEVVFDKAGCLTKEYDWPDFHRTAKPGRRAAGHPAAEPGSAPAGRPR